MSSGERLSWVLVAALCLFFGYRLGAQSSSRELSELRRDLEASMSSAPARSTSLNVPSHTDAGGIELVGGTAEMQDEQDEPFQSSTPPPLSEAELARLCPPCDCPCATPKPKPVKARAKRLPPPKMTPLERAKLLAWVKKHSERLRRCRDTGQPIYRLHSRLKLKADATGVRSVQLKGKQIPSSALSCIRSEMLKWPPPEGLTPAKHPLLIFNLQLD